MQSEREALIMRQMGKSLVLVVGLGGAAERLANGGQARGTRIVQAPPQ